MSKAMLEQRLEAALKQRRWQRKLPAATAGEDFASNDYLGLAKMHFPQSISEHGSTGSRLLTGNSSEAEKFEELCARVFKAPAALLFNSGYTANLGLLPSISQQDDLIFADSRIHASIKTSFKLCKAKSFYFPHNDLEALERRLRRRPKHACCFVVVESLYSMDGDRAPLLDLSELCKKFSCYLIIDEAHGLGTSGPGGLGSSTAPEVEAYARVYTFGKGLGSHGACILGSQTLKETLINFCNSFIYTTALGPQHIESLYCRLEFLRQHPELVDNLRQRCEIVNKFFGFSSDRGPIYSLLHENPAKVTETLAKAGFKVYPIYPPTVKQPCIRVVLHAFNKLDSISKLCEILSLDATNY